MKKPYQLPDELILITSRYFYAVELLRQQKKIRGLGTLAKKWNLSRETLSEARSYPDNKRLHTEFIYALCRDYNVSLNWLYFGVGEIFTK